MQSLDDVKYEQWSRTRLDRLLVDYLLRNGYKDSAVALAKEKGIENLVDVEMFVQMSRIRESLLQGRVTEALAWCNENKKELRRMEVSSEMLEKSSADEVYRVISNSCCASNNTSNSSGHKTQASSWNR